MHFRGVVQEILEVCVALGQEVAAELEKGFAKHAA